MARVPGWQAAEGGAAAAANGVEARVLLAAPTRRDAEVTIALLRRVGLACVACPDLAQLAREIEAGAGAVLATAEALAAPEMERVLEALDGQPAWSDLPVVLLSRGDESVAAQPRLCRLRNVTLLERPATMQSLASAVQAAVRARLRQYEIREQMEALRRAKLEREALLASERVARREAERLNRMKDEFLATLSHELRTPLNAIMGWTYVLRSQGGDPAMREECFAVIERNVGIQARLIDDLLDMNRIVSGKLRLEAQALPLQAVLDAVLESVMPALIEKGLRLRRRGRAGRAMEGVVLGDPARLQQIFWNLLSNAIKFTPPGGSIGVTARRRGGDVEVAIRDTGQGIDAEVLPHVFDRFVQADASATRNHGGLGLGLSIVRSLTEMHGGSVAAASPGRGAGSTFTVRLPLAWGERARPEEAARQAALPGLAADPRLLRGLHVLVVDDEPDTLSLYQRVLAEAGASAHLAASAAAAEALLKTLRPDLVISDIGLPGRDGYDFLRQARRAGCQWPAIAVTAFARPEDRHRSLQAGYQAHLSKPVSPAELIAAATRLLKRAS